MKKIASYVWVVLAVMALASCSSRSFKKTKSGLQYNIISDGNGDAVKKGQWLKISFVEKIHDSLLNSSPAGLPEYVRVDSVGPVYNPAEVFGFLRKGDSSTIIMLADTLQRKYGGQLPPFVHKKDKIILSLRVLDVFASEELKMVDQKKSIDGEKDKEIKQIEDYLAKNNITDAKKTKEGVYYQILSHGDGPQADSGKTVAIKYTGYSLEGKPFDSNTDSTKQTPPYHPMKPYEFRSGVSGAIRGILEAIQQFKKGDKGKLYIPAMLGYGPQGAGALIKPFENLIFEIEVVEVKDAPPAPTFQPNRPQMPPMRGAKPTK
jgi:FKBP-type peptidyl-prolyl cis-trans isomerase FkpA